MTIALTPEPAPIPIPEAGHIIVVGAGAVGQQVVKELINLKRAPFLVVERDPDCIGALRSEYEHDIPALLGDALDDGVLLQANIETAQGLVTTLSRDRDGLFLCLSARQLNSDLRIVARLEDDANAEKFRNVGADEVAGIASLGGKRLAHAMLRQELATYSDALTASSAGTLLLMEIPIEERCLVAGLRIATAGLQQRTGCVIIGHRPRARGPYNYRPDPQQRLQPGGGIVALGDDAELLILVELLSAC